MRKSRIGRPIPEGPMPVVDVRGKTAECGRMLGAIWRETLRHEADHAPPRPAWWRDRRVRRLIDRFAPHLPTLYRGMARGAAVSEDRVGPRAALPDGGCTSFALHPNVTLDGAPISGQTKDVSAPRGLQLQVLRLALTDAPPTLTATYPGWLFGHGFVRGGCAVFRNSLYARAGEGNGLPYDVWGILALHCPTVEHVVEMTRRHGVRDIAHCTVADERGGIVGMELVAGTCVVLKPRGGIYTHANAIVSSPRLRRYETSNRQFPRKNSLFRQQRLREILERSAGRLTPQLAYCAMCDQENYPWSVCREESLEACTAAVMIAEPTRRRLTVTRGIPSQNWPVCYDL